jgi:hypothetical protein
MQQEKVDLEAAGKLATLGTLAYMTLFDVNLEL